MKELDARQLHTFLAEKYKQIFAASGILGWDFYDMWPLWAYYFKETDPSVKVETDDSVLSIKFPDRCWVIPLTSDMKLISKSLLQLAEDNRLAIPLHIATWNGLKVSEVSQDFQTRTLDVINMSKESLKGRKQGIRRYSKSNYKVVQTSRDNCSDVVNLIHTWGNQKLNRNESSDPNTDLYIRMLQDPKYIDVWPFQQCLSVYDESKLIGFGLGAMLSDNKWSMIIRIADSDYAYLSDFVYQQTSKLFLAFDIESDGHAFTSMDPDAEENASLRWYKERYCDPTLTVFTAITSCSPVKVSHENPNNSIR